MTKARFRAIAECMAISALTAALTACSHGGGSTPTTAPPVSTVVLSGSYVFSVTGTDPTDGDYAVIGSFVTDGKGNITSGVADYNLGSGIDADVPLTGTYTSTGGLTTVSLVSPNAGFTDSFTTTPVATGTSSIGNFDSTGSGTLYPQVTSGFTPVGTYTYTLQGEGQGSVTGNGSLVVGTGNTISSGTLTYTDAATMTTYAAVTGFVYSPEVGGRGQAALEGKNLAYYVISPSQVVMIELDQRALVLMSASKQ